MYIKVNQQGQILIVHLYVDVVFFTRNMSIKEFKTTLKREFKMTDLGLMKYFLGIEVNQFEIEIFISQSKYANDISRRFRMLNCKSTTM